MLIHLILSLVLGGAAVAITAKIVPGVKVRGGFKDAIVVGAIYGLLKVLLQKLLIVLSLPLVLVTFGLFIFVINAFLLWLTNRLLDRFEVRSLGALILATLCLSLIDIAFHIVLNHGTVF